MVINCVEVTFNISFNKPFYTFPFQVYLFLSRVCSSTRSESMRQVTKHRFIDRFQNHNYGLLNDFISWTCYPLWSKFSIGFRNHFSPNRFKLKSMIFQFFNSFSNVTLFNSIQSLLIHSRSYGSFIRWNLLICSNVEIFFLYQFIYSCNFFFSISSSFSQLFQSVQPNIS